MYFDFLTYFSVFFLLFCLVVFIFALSAFSQTHPERGLKSIQNGITLIESAEKKIGLTKRVNIKYTASDFRDPLFPDVPMRELEKTTDPKIIKPIKPKSVELPPLLVQGIIWNPDNPLAIINNQVFKEKEVITLPKGKDDAGKVTIINIDKDLSSFIGFYESMGLKIFVEQYEMMKMI